MMTQKVVNAWHALVKDLLGFVNGFHMAGEGAGKSNSRKSPRLGTWATEMEKKFIFFAHLNSWYEIYTRHICGTQRD